MVPLPGAPVIEEATTGLFPTLRFVFQTKIVHNVSRYYLGILFLVVFSCVTWKKGLLYVLFLLVAPALILWAMFLPALATAGSKATSVGEEVSILDRKLVGIFETTTISSRDSAALENWLLENGYSVPTNAGPVIAGYVKDGWVFVATKVGRNDPKLDSSTPQPLSFTFATDRPVYPMQLTGLASKLLNVDLYVMGDTGYTARHFAVDSCAHRDLFHPLLVRWCGDSAVVTKLTAKLSPEDMRQDVWLDPSPSIIGYEKRLYSRNGAQIIALNCGVGFLVISLLVLYAFIRIDKVRPPKLRWIVSHIILFSLGLTAIIYTGLPKIEVKLVKVRGGNHHVERNKAFVLCMAPTTCHTVAEYRTAFQSIISNPTNLPNLGGENWDNRFVGGQFREEDSPGNYILRERNGSMQLILIDGLGREDINPVEFPLKH